MSSCTSGKRGRPSDPAKHAGIIKAAADCFFAEGFAAVSIERIAATAGVSKVTIYNHFGDKRALFAAAVEYECEKMRRQFSILPTSSQSLHDRLIALGEAIMAFLSRPEILRFDRRLAAETENNPQIGRAFLDAGPYRMRAAFAGLLENLAKSGALKIPDPMLAAEQFVSLCKGIGDLERRYGIPGDPAADKARIAGAVDIFLVYYQR